MALNLGCHNSKRAHFAVIRRHSFKYTINNMPTDHAGKWSNENTTGERVDPRM